MGGANARGQWGEAVERVQLCLGVRSYLAVSERSELYGLHERIFVSKWAEPYDYCERSAEWAEPYD